MVSSTSFAVAARAAIALIGGYVVAALFAIALAGLLPLQRADAVLFGTITSFIIYVGVVIRVYARWRKGFRQSMAWLHTWTGLLLGWVLYLVFITGSAAYYRDEITLWMKPEVYATSVPANFMDRAIRELEQRSPNALRWIVSSPNERNPSLYIQWQERGADGQPVTETRYWNAQSQSFVPTRDTEGGDFLYRFHYDLHMPNGAGEWIVGLATMLMFVALVTGVITHRRFFKDFFTFRPGKSAQRSWLDAHNVTSVLALPFHFMITYTGLLTLMFLYMPWAQRASYGEETALFSQEAYGNSNAPAPAGLPGTLTDVGLMVAETDRRWGSERVERLIISNPGDANSLLETRPRYSKQISLNHSKILFDGENAAVINDVGTFGPGVKTRGGLVGLHVARFAEPGLRALFFLCGLAGSAMVATGLVLWIVKRRKEALTPGFGDWLVERLNIAAIMGGPIALAAYFAANRILPADFPGRADWEIRAFLLALLAMAVHAFVRPPKSAWKEQLGLAGFMYTAIPLINGALTERGLTRSLASGDWLFIGFDLTMLVLGATFVWIFFYLSRRTGNPVTVVTGAFN